MILAQILYDTYDLRLIKILRSFRKKCFSALGLYTLWRGLGTLICAYSAPKAILLII